jgi:hypothetical protein
VIVHDILHEKNEKGWTQKVSAYPKLRISSGQIASLLEQKEFVVTHKSTINRMEFIVAEKITR